MALIMDRVKLKYGEIFNESKTIREEIDKINQYDAILVATPNISREKRDEILFRANYFLNDKKIQIISNIAFLPKEVNIPVLIFGDFDIENSKIKFNQSVYKIDYETNYSDGWEWHRLLNALYPIDENILAAENRKKFVKMMNQFEEEGKNKSYIFGTGPSLSNYKDYNFDDGVRIVCNTIVKDKDTWDYIKPDIFVAADAHYHYDFNELAVQFREDLKKRLRENPNCKFLYFIFFHNFIIREFEEFKDQLIALPNNFETAYFDKKFELDIRSRNGNNVLDLMLIPLTCAISKNVELLGFDGRKPDDKLFWKYSDTHAYSDLISKVKIAHPQFFEKLVPEKDPENYVRFAFADLDKYLSSFEEKGWKFKMLNDSYTPALQKRRIV
jgi:hypothetical protein